MVKIELERMRAISQWALLYCIPRQVVGICLEYDENHVNMEIFADAPMDEHPQWIVESTLNDILIEIGLGDGFATTTFVDANSNVLRAKGNLWVYIAYGYTTEMILTLDP